MTEETRTQPDRKKFAEIIRRPVPAALCAFCLGALSSFSMAPYDFPPVLIITLGGFYALINTQEKRLPVFLCSWSFGFGYFTFSLSWIANALLVDGNEYAWAYPLALIGPPIILTFFPAITLYLWRRFYNPEKLSGFIGFCAFLGLSEWMRGHLFTGFPWNLLGYTWNGFLSVAQVTSLSDVYLLTLLTITWAAIFGFLPIYNATKTKKIIIAATVFLSFLASCLYGYDRLSIPIKTRDDISFVLVQANVAQSEKWQPELFVKHFNTHLDLTESQGLTAAKNVKATYIIWPETAIPLAFTHHQQAAEMIAQTLQYFPENAFLLAGAISWPDKEAGQHEGYYNSLVTYDKTGQIIAKFDKFHLVPFGEYIPYEDELNLTPFTGFGGFNKGPGPRTMSVEPGFSFSPLVCYEIIFPRAVTDEREGNIRPDAIINVTNDGWYGKSAGPYQHLAQARFRAIEEGIPVIRVANTGFSAIIDPLGNVLFRTDLYTAEASRQPLPQVINHKKSSVYLSITILLVTYLLSVILAGLEKRTAIHN